MGTDAELDELLAEIRGRIDLLSRCLPTSVDPAAISLTAKIPYKLMIFREAMIWRTEELARSALDLLERGDLLAACLLVRGVLENACVLWFLMELVDQQVANGVSSTLGADVSKLLLGHRNNSDMPKALHVLKAIDAAEKKIPGISRNYDFLSEFAHPNWSGTSLPYCLHDESELCTHLGKNIRGARANLNTAATSLRASLAMVELAYNSIGNRFPSFVTACERALSAASSKH